MVADGAVVDGAVVDGAVVECRKTSAENPEYVLVLGQSAVDVRAPDPYQESACPRKVALQLQDDKEPPALDN